MEYLETIVPKNIKDITGQKFNRVHVISFCDNTFTYNGIDRVDNSIGYVESNCVSCCRTCNQAKSSLSITEFSDWIMAIAAHRKTWADE